MNKLRQALNSGKTIIGTHISMCSPALTEVIAECGFDYIWIDTEHTTLSLEELQNRIIAAKAGGAATVARVPSNDPIRLKPLLEMGPDGIVVPQVNSFEEAQKAISSFLYPPCGERGYGPLRASRYGLTPLEEYFQNAKDIVRILQVENIKAVHDLERIVTIPEIDVLLIGPCDLAASMGKIGQWDDPEVQETIDYACRFILDSGKKLGVSYGYCPQETMQKWKSRGVNMISLSSDTDSIVRGARDTYQQMHSIFQK